ncbi:NAD(P)H-hydrate dehydratase [Comamonas flocculans]|uniref:ADP-dependent (S)-NAD(P)H-hydrate dehydratase n=1 Tax=Comamonas flocculans TaxID=2597701 RepID=A0A5B8RQM5_9BURK|nr:NAD(P)H-hydrate dehydratase [Comamonas flocculans]QEA11911.1 NAD(P)H-hydrate dehydratase [Comamonas flocculans]
MRAVGTLERLPLHASAATRALEAGAAARLPAHTLMQRAGQALAALGHALAPHARSVWVVCGPGNNGGDGLLAAALLQGRGLTVSATLLAEPRQLPEDAAWAWRQACAAGVAFVDGAPTLAAQDLCIDALLGLGLTSAARPQPPAPRLLQALRQLRASGATVLCADLPSGLVADTGCRAPGFEDLPPAAGALHTLSLLTLHPGLFTAQGRDAAGTLWWDDLQTDTSAEPACALLCGRPRPAERAHASHKGSFGDVAILGGEGLSARGMGMTGAAVLAGLAALHAGAGRVLLALLDDGATQALPDWPELMLRRPDALALQHGSVVCGCGGGLAVAPLLARVLAEATRLVLDADALNALAQSAPLQQALAARASQPGRATVLTPHPLEAARLLGTSAGEVQADRLRAASALAERYRCTVVLKGSGSVIAAPEQTPCINPTGNALLATAGTGDVLAGLIGARLAGAPAADAASVQQLACDACWQHGALADHWPAGRALTAAALARALAPAAG